MEHFRMQMNPTAYQLVHCRRQGNGRRKIVDNYDTGGLISFSKCSEYQKKFISYYAGWLDQEEDEKMQFAFKLN